MINFNKGVLQEWMRIASIITVKKRTKSELETKIKSLMYEEYNSPNQKTMAYLEKETRSCPNCNIYIIRSEGCKVCFASTVILFLIIHLNVPSTRKRTRKPIVKKNKKRLVRYFQIEK